MSLDGGPEWIDVDRRLRTSAPSRLDEYGIWDGPGVGTYIGPGSVDGVRTECRLPRNRGPERASRGSGGGLDLDRVAECFESADKFAARASAIDLVEVGRAEIVVLDIIA